MTEVHKNLEDSLYNFVSTLFPDWRIKFPYDNGPDLQTPYMEIDVRKMRSIGNEESSTDQAIRDDGKFYTQTIQNYEASVRFEFIGKSDVNTQLAEMAQMLDFSLRTQRGYEEQERNSLSLMKKDDVRRIPVRRETDTFMYYQLDVKIGYSVIQVTEQDYIEGVGIHGVYYDAGREPDHIIESTIEINP